MLTDTVGTGPIRLPSCTLPLCQLLEISILLALETFIVCGAMLKDLVVYLCWSADLPYFSLLDGSFPGI